MVLKRITRLFFLQEQFCKRSKLNFYSTFKNNLSLGRRTKSQIFNLITNSCIEFNTQRKLSKCILFHDYTRTAYGLSCVNTNKNFINIAYLN